MALLVRGEARFTADIQLVDQVWAAFVRSPVAHADIVALDMQGIGDMPGVLGAFTGRDLVAAGIGVLPCTSPVTDRSGHTMPVPPWHPLANGRVYHIGQPIAVIIAETAEMAEEAAGAVEMELRELPAVVDASEALAAGAPRLWDHITGNLAADWEAGDPGRVEQAFGCAAQVTSVEIRSQRLAAVPLEPRSALAQWNGDDKQYILITPSQGAAVLRGQLANCLNVQLARLRVITPDVGGAFGSRTQAYPEHVALLYAARALCRPVKWVASRSETFLSESQGRDTVMRGRLAVDDAGRATALDADVVANLGAFATPYGAHISTHNFARCLPGVYDIPAVHIRVRCAYTTTLPVGPYRGAGRPEATLLLERLFDSAARQLGADRIALRRRNLVTPAMMPHKTATGSVYDSGDFPQVLDRAWDMIDGAGFEDRRAEAVRRGRLRGLGVGLFLEASGGAPREHAAARFDAAGHVEVAVGGQASGQGHRQVLAKFAAQRLGIAANRISIRQGDTDRLGCGGSSTASRTLVAAANAAGRALDEAIEAGRRLAALRTDRPVADIDYRDGAFYDRKSGAHIGLGDLAAWLRTRPNLPPGAPRSLDQTTFADSPPTYPNGCHMIEVEIDLDTGAVILVAYVAVNDIGSVFSRPHAEAQVHGGIVQGLGQALGEQVRYDAETGQLISGSFLDYAMPRAGDLLGLRIEFLEVPCRTNDLGAKGAGEAGVAGALAAANGAVLDALAPLGVTDLAMPFTSDRVWQALVGKAFPHPAMMHHASPSSIDRPPANLAHPNRS